MFGLGKKKKRMQQAATPGILPGFVPNAPAPQFEPSFTDKLGGLGAMLMQADGTMGSGHMAAYQQRMGDKRAQFTQQQQAQAAAARQQRIDSLLAQMNGGKGANTQQQLAAMLDPKSLGSALAHNSRQQVFQHDNRVGVYGPNGMENFDLGASQADLNATLGHNVEMRGQDIGLQETQIKDATTRRGQDVDRYGIDKDFEVGMGQVAVGHGRNAVGREKNAIDREQFAYKAANPTSDLGKNPLYMTDENGNVIIGQLGNGQIVPAQTPQGLSVMSPYERSFEQSRGRSTGKAQGEATGALPNTLMRGQVALDTIDKMLDHKGLDGAIGNIQGRLPDALLGDNERAFRAYADQAQGTAFMQAFESLKGGGQITEVEGLKAEQAMARMNRAQSEDDYRAALNDFRSVIERGMETARKRAGGSGQELADPLGLR